MCLRGARGARRNGRIESGRYDCAIVLSVELMRNVPGHIAADPLGAAAWRGREAIDAKYVWPTMFSDLAEEYDECYGLDYQHLMAISKKNFSNGRRNPYSQARNWTFSDANFSQSDDANPVVEGRMRRMDCGQVTDGAAVVFLASQDFAEEFARERDIALEDLSVIQGWGHTTAPLLMQTKLEESANGGYIFPWARKAITDAYSRAGIEGPQQLEAIETHDCFSITEYMAIEHFGLAAPGEAWKAIENGSSRSWPTRAFERVSAVGADAVIRSAILVVSALRSSAGNTRATRPKLRTSAELSLRPVKKYRSRLLCRQFLVVVLKNLLLVQDLAQ